MDTLVHGDCLSLAKQIADKSIDLVIADPPYFEIYGDFDFGVFASRDSYMDWCRQWILECKRILKDTGTLILWGGLGKNEITIARLAIMIEDEGIFNRVNWITQRNTRGIGTSRNYMSAREDFLFLTKSQNYTFNVPYSQEASSRKDLGANGKPRKNIFKRISNVWTDITEVSQSSIERCFHPTVKALRLCDRLIQTHSNEGDTIFVPFIGSGSEIISAIRSHRHFIGSELNKNYFLQSVERVKRLAHIDFVSTSKI